MAWVNTPVEIDSNVVLYSLQGVLPVNMPEHIDLKGAIYIEDSQYTLVGGSIKVEDGKVTITMNPSLTEDLRLLGVQFLLAHRDELSPRGSLIWNPEPQQKEVGRD